MTLARIHRFVRIHDVEDFLRLGWVALPSLAGTHHGYWSVHVAWLCECVPVVPSTRPDERSAA